MNKYSVHEFTPNAAQIANGQGHLCQLLANNQ